MEFPPAIFEFILSPTPQFDDVAVAGRFIEMHAHPGQSPSDLLIRLAAMMEEGGYRESDFSGTQPGVARKRRTRVLTRCSKELTRPAKATPATEAQSLGLVR
jgi:hypothetical protein